LKIILAKFQTQADYMIRKLNVHINKNGLIFLTIILISHALLFTTLFQLTHRTTVASTGVIWAAVLGWRFGKITGTLTTILLTLTTTIVLAFNDRTLFISATHAIDPYSGSIIQMLIGFLSGTLSDLVRKLKSEIAYRKKIEKELNDYKDNLEDIIRKKTDELTIKNEYLRQVEKMDALGQLASGIAHDFKNILFAINGYATLIKKKAVDDQALQKYSVKILEASEMVSKLIGNMLSFSRNDSKYEMVNIDIHSIIDNTIHLLEHSISKQISLSCQLGAEFHDVYGNSAMLQNVFLNMGINAKDAIESEGKICFKTQNRTFNENDTLVVIKKLIPGEYIIISVEDSGKGINEDIIHKIFEPFFTTKEKGKGTGMGLTTSYTTIKEHHGIIDVKSQQGKGTTFDIYLPVFSSKKNPIVSPSEKYASSLI
jgi:signal transduction histidine kinase